MPEETLDGQSPTGNTGAESPSTADSQSSDDKSMFDDVLIQANRQKVEELMKSKGLTQEEINAIQLDREAKIVQEFSEADNRNYKSIDGVKETFTSRGSANSKLVQELSEARENKDDDGSEKGGDQKTDKKPADEKSEAETPKGMVSVDDHNRLAIKSLLSENPELSFVKGDVQKLASDQEKSVLELFEKNEEGKFINSQAAMLFEVGEARQIKDQQRQQAEIRSKSMPPTGSAGQHAPNGQKMTLKEFEQKKHHMSPEERARVLEGGMVG